VTLAKTSLERRSCRGSAGRSRGPRRFQAATLFLSGRSLFARLVQRLIKFRIPSRDLPTAFIHFSFSSQFCLRNVLILLSVYKVRGVEATFRYGLYIIENEGGLVAGGVDLNSKPALIPRKLLTLQHAKMPKTATRANLSFSFHSVCLKGMNPDL